MICLVWIGFIESIGDTVCVKNNGNIVLVVCVKNNGSRDGVGNISDIMCVLSYL